MHLEALGEVTGEPTSVTIERTSSSACDSRTSASGGWPPIAAQEKSATKAFVKGVASGTDGAPGLASSAPGTDTMSSSVAG